HESQTGVFIGISTNEYHSLQDEKIESMNSYITTGNSSSVAAGRISYVFGLKGPSIAIDTACSSSLVALNLACNTLYNMENSITLLGGVNLILKPELFVGFSKAHMLSPDGKCKSKYTQSLIEVNDISNIFFT